MLPKINNKSFLECTESDLQVLIDNDEYRENEYIDYKRNFAFLEASDKIKRQEKVTEFKSDVCAFANAEGGYLIFGISDKNGCAEEIIGIDIPDGNTDKFELDRRNNLASISPKTPFLKFHFIHINDGKYVLVLYVKSDNYAPYVHIEDEKNYKIYKRIGNGKKIIGYQELKKMFNQSLSLDKELYNFRLDRINYYRSQEDNDEKWYSQFMLLHIIPDTFLDTSYNQNMLVLEKIKKKQFGYIFPHFNCGNSSIPCVDGLRFTSESPYYSGNICYLYNNGIAECFMPLRKHLNIGLSNNPNGHIAWKYLWEIIKDTYISYASEMKAILSDKKIFVCVSILGCKGATSESNDFDFHPKTIDRNTVICAPISNEDIDIESENELLIKKLYIEFAISLGIKNDKSLESTIREVYHI